VNNYFTNFKLQTETFTP